MQRFSVLYPFPAGTKPSNGVQLILHRVILTNILVNQSYTVIIENDNISYHK